jgi:hypothetical protein
MAIKYPVRDITDTWESSYDLVEKINNPKPIGNDFWATPEEIKNIISTSPAHYYFNYKTLYGLNTLEKYQNFCLTLENAIYYMARVLKIKGNYWILSDPNLTKMLEFSARFKSKKKPNWSSKEYKYVGDGQVGDVKYKVLSCNFIDNKVLIGINNEYMGMDFYRVFYSTES